MPDFWQYGFYVGKLPGLPNSMFTSIHQIRALFTEKPAHFFLLH
jgi:hypothetical protein